MTIAMGQTFPKRRNVTLGSCALPPVSGILCMVCLLCGVSLVWTAGSRQQPIKRVKKHKCMNIILPSFYGCRTKARKIFEIRISH